MQKKIGVTDRAVSKWENGRGLPDVSYMKKLCAILGISVDELLSGERIPKEKRISAKEKSLIDLLVQRELEMKKRHFTEKLCAVNNYIWEDLMSTYDGKCSYSYRFEEIGSTDEDYLKALNKLNDIVKDVV